MQTVTSEPGNPGQAGAPSVIETLTSVHLIVIAILIVLVVIAMIYGGRLKRTRRAARHVEERRIAEMGGLPTPAPAEPAATTSLGQEEERPVAGQEKKVSSVEEEGLGASAAPVTTPPVAPEPPPLEPDAPEPAPATAAFAPPPEPAAAPVRDADAPVTTLKGLGPKVASRLGELGITRVGQIAALDDDQADALDAQLGTFRGRLHRDRWVEQARFLAAGDRAGFEAVFGRL